MLVLSGFCTVYAQGEYRPGYLVTTAQDTLRGFIEYRWNRSPQKISFRATLEGADRIYTPLDIRAFSVVGDRYQSAIVQIETSPVSLANMSDTSVPQLETDTAFIREVITGERSLYRHYPEGAKGKNLFYISNNGQWELLVHKPFKQVQGGAVRVANNNRYISQLSSYLQGCPTIQKKTRKLRYEEKSIERLFLAYYACTTTKPAYENDTKKYLLEAGILAGGINTSLDFKTNGVYSPLAHTSFSRDFSVGGGLFLDVIRRRNEGKWSLNNELLYTSYKTEGVFYFRNTSEENYERSRCLLEYSYLKLNTMIRFKYPVGSVYLFANVGISNGISVRKSDREIYESRLNGPVQSEENSLFHGGDHGYEPGYLGGLGVKYQRFSFETRYEQTTGMLAFGDKPLRSKVERMAFLLSYRLTKPKA